MDTKNISQGSLIEITYDIWAEGVSKETSIKLEVNEVTEASIIAGPGIGTQIHLTGSRSVYAPTSSDGFHADGDERVKVGTNASIEIIE